MPSMNKKQTKCSKMFIILSDSKNNPNVYIFFHFVWKEYVTN